MHLDMPSEAYLCVNLYSVIRRTEPNIKYYIFLTFSAIKWICELMKVVYLFVKAISLTLDKR